jgi:hypothetical protein
VELTRASLVRVLRPEVGLPGDGQGPLLLISGPPIFFQPRRDWAQ